MFERSNATRSNPRTLARPRTRATRRSPVSSRPDERSQRRLVFGGRRRRRRRPPPALGGRARHRGANLGERLVRRAVRLPGGPSRLPRPRSISPRISRASPSPPRRRGHNVATSFGARVATCGISPARSRRAPTPPYAARLFEIFLEGNPSNAASRSAGPMVKSPRRRRRLRVTLASRRMPRYRGRRDRVRRRTRVARAPRRDPLGAARSPSRRLRP